MNPIFQRKKEYQNRRRTGEFRSVRMILPILLICCGLSLFTLTGCSGKSEDSSLQTSDGEGKKLWEEPLEKDLNEENALSGEPIRIGAIYALSGNNAAIGTNILRGIDFAVEEINQSGGVNGRPLEIVRGDSQGSPVIAGQVAEQMIREKQVHAVIGCHQSTVTEAVFDVCEKYEIPMITAISTVDRITSEPREYAFRLCPMNSLYVEDMFEYLVEQDESTETEVKRIAVFADTSMIGEEAIENARFYAEKYHLEITEEIRYTVGAASLTEEVQKLIDAKPDAVLAESYASDAILFVKTMHEMGYTPPILLAKANGFTDPSFLSASDGISDGVISVVEWNSDMKKGHEISDRFEEIFGVPMNGHSAEVYTAVWTLKTAFESAESTEGEAVKDALQALDIQGSFPNGPEIMLPYDGICFENLERGGVVYYNENKYASVAIAQIRKGEYHTIWPSDLSE